MQKIVQLATAEPKKTTDQDRPIVDGVQEPPQLKLDIPANRYATASIMLIMI